MSKTLANQILQQMHTFMGEAGEFALNKQFTAQRELKLDKTVVTEVDIAIAKKAKGYFSEYFESSEHIFIDEEFVDDIGTPEEVLGKHKYTWLMDPIHGTAGFVQNRKLWGISIGIFKGDQPWLGMIYLPAMGELIYTDGEKSYQIINPFMDNQHKLEIKPKIFAKLNKQVFVESYASDGISWSDELLGNSIRVNTPESMVDAFCSCILGRSAGATVLDKFSLWDVAAAWAISKNIGLEIFSLPEGKKLERLTTDFLRPNWKLNGRWLMCRKENFEYIRDGLIHK